MGKGKLQKLPWRNNTSLNLIHTNVHKTNTSHVSSSVEGSDVGHRRRSNTALRLEKLENKRRAQTEAQLVTVRLNPDETGRNQLSFVRDNSYLERQKSKKVTDVFSTKKLLEYVKNYNIVFA